KVFAGYAHIQNVDDMPVHWRERIAHFFEHYKDLDKGKWVKISGWGDAKDAAGNARPSLFGLFIRRRNRLPHRLDHLRVIAFAEDRRAGDERVGAGARDLADVVHLHAAIHLQTDIAAARIDDLSRALQFLQR